MTLFVFLVSCSHKKPESVKKESSPEREDDVELMLSQEELKIHLCLAEAKENSEDYKKCLVGTSYEKNANRSPSSDLIQKYSWFFDSKDKISKFYSITKKILRAQKRIAMTGADKLFQHRGIGVQGDVYFGFGAIWLAEFAYFNQELGLFCSPGIHLKTDIGVEMGMYVTQALSCSSHEQYAGASVNFFTGISGELIGAPVGVNLGYGFGIEVKEFVSKVKALKKSKRINSLALAQEVATLHSQDLIRHFGPNGKNAIAVFYYGLQIAKFLNPSLTTFQMKGQSAFIKRMMSEKKSIGKLFKDLYRTKKMQAFYDKRGLQQTEIFMNLLGDTLNGCDTMNVSGSVGLSLSPVHVGVGYSNLNLLLKTDVNDLGALKVLTPLSLLNPFLLNPKDLTVVTKLAKEVLSLPNKVKTECTNLGLSLK